CGLAHILPSASAKPEQVVMSSSSSRRYGPNRERWTEHAVDAGRLPRRHDDPSDRALVAQARAEGLRLVTAGRVLAQYDVRLLDAAR
ncbi:MAG: hypothetical protein M3Y19_06840, partial [Actinomycetota bacterium]|nr:hypothetical protein [Actinomycetota bacterium]